jgi:alpha-ketoglutarate-dependent taurine dioxygenase
MSTPMQKYLQSLTMSADQQDNFINASKKGGFELVTEPRGHPKNSGVNFRPVHPVVRTNPVTGLNSVYSVGLHVKKINGVTQSESDYLKKMLLDTVTQNHDLQVRFRWEPKSCAIWDNRSVYHAATPDFDDKYERLGIRYTSVGEEPYFDPATGQDTAVNGNGVANGVNGH